MQGNSGAGSGNFLGTLDQTPLNLGANSQIGLRILPNSTSPNLSGGYSGNQISTTVRGATIAGGGAFFYENRVWKDYATVGGGANHADGYGAVAAGGIDNRATSDYSVVAGGLHNYATGSSAAIGGGFYNVASGYVAYIGGGDLNVASTQNATIGGGYSNTISGGQLIANATIGGGVHKVTGFAGVIAGGHGNQIAGEWGTIGGGGFEQRFGPPLNREWRRIQRGTRRRVNRWGRRLEWLWHQWQQSQRRGFHHRRRFRQPDQRGWMVRRNWRRAAKSDLCDCRDQSQIATIGGGYNNKVTLGGATVGGGNSNTAGGFDATVAGGSGNNASGSGAMVPGGLNNLAQGSTSFAAGNRAKSFNNGCFTWADSNNFDFGCASNNAFTARATGGVFFVSAIDGAGNATAGVQLAAGGSGWGVLSDRSSKTNLAAVNGRQVLEALAQIPIGTWSYKTQDASIRHIGPMAQDFSAAFGVGEDNRHINTVDADGVSLAAIQGLYQISQEKDIQIARQQEQITALQTQISDLQRRLDNLGPLGAASGNGLPFDLSTVLSLAALIGVAIMWRQKAQGR
ncbi:MAG: tail fiber domain-containing protein [Holophaga sp.]|nr:tail fiber domain-containing protein [Holophaga sp.]